MKRDSGLIAYATGLLVPIILLTGLYLAVNGHISPGGGFQAGAVLAAAFVCKHLMQPNLDLSYDHIAYIEKLVLFIILLIPIFVFMILGQSHLVWLGPYYYIVMNGLIALKVASGFTILFIRFIYYEVK